MDGVELAALPVFNFVRNAIHKLATRHILHRIVAGVVCLVNHTLKVVHLAVRRHPIQANSSSHWESVRVGRGHHAAREDARSPDTRGTSGRHPFSSDGWL